MDEEMQARGGWTKTIPRARDRMQSRVLVGVGGSLLGWMSLVTLQRVFLVLQGGDDSSVLTPLVISVIFVVMVRTLRAATRGGGIAGGMICLVLVSWTEQYRQTMTRSALAPLTALFLLTFLSTRAGRKKKAEAGLAEGRRGRNAAQVIANLSVAALAVTPLAGDVVGGWMARCHGTEVANVWVFSTMKVMCLAALVEATADTVSSEIGQAFGGRPVMLPSLQRVQPGTDGAVTLLGSVAGIGAGVMVAVVGMWGLRLPAGEAGIALLAGVGGLFFDSLLGATVERRGWWGNDLVNFSSTAFAALLAAVMLGFARL